MIHERPIIFSAPMICALLEGRKTQTRRLVANDAIMIELPETVRGDWPGHNHIAVAGRYKARLNKNGAVTINSQGRGFDLGVKPGEFNIACPYASGRTVLADRGAAGKHWTIIPVLSRLWVRETWCKGSDEDVSEATPEALRPSGLAERPRGPTHPDEGYPAFAYYKATDDNIVNTTYPERSPWKSPIHMPRWACRLVLDVVGVRIERLQDITEEDAKAEGVPSFFDRFDRISQDQRICDGEYARDKPYRASYACAWDEINGDRALWNTNPWVWVIDIRRALGATAATRAA